jgi:cyclic pyranopterin phosphate synthase
MTTLTHLNAAGEAHMVDVGDKPTTRRRAVAEGRIRMRDETRALIEQNALGKGDALAVARVAGILAAKKTGELIPLCHPLALTHVEVELIPEPAPSAIRCRATVETSGPTGVEMEALSAVSIALLTLYDMAKAVERGMVIESVRLLEKSGGRSGDWQAGP